MSLKNYPIVVRVKFVKGHNTKKSYNFAAYDDTLEVGEDVVVLSQYGYGFENFGVANIHEVIPVESYTGTPPTAEVVGRIDLSEFNARRAARRLQQELTDQIDKRVRENPELYLQAVKTAAESDPVLEEMLERLASIRSV